MVPHAYSTPPPRKWRFVASRFIATRFAVAWTFSAVAASTHPLVSKYRPILFSRRNLPLRTCEPCDPLYQLPFRFSLQLASTYFSWPSFPLNTSDSHPIHSSLQPSTSLGGPAFRQKLKTKNISARAAKPGLVRSQSALHPLLLHTFPHPRRSSA